MANSLKELSFLERIAPITGALSEEQQTTALMMLGQGQDWKSSWLAYALATAWYEHTFTSEPCEGLLEAMEAGSFTGKKLGQYLVAEQGDPQSFFWCRKIIGGLEGSEEVVALAASFQEVLLYLKSREAIN